MKISVTGYNKDGTLGVYDQEVKEKDRSCLTEKEECTSWLFFAVMIIILAGLSYICLQGGLARGHFVQVKGQEGGISAPFPAIGQLSAVTAVEISRARSRWPCLRHLRCRSLRSHA